MPTSIMRLSSCPLSTRPKAPLMSNSSVRAICLHSQAFSTKVTSLATALDVLRPWRQPDWPL